MLEDENYKIVNMHICNFERKDGILTFNAKKYPKRLCVHDKKNGIVIEVDTYHKYPYIKVVNTQLFYHAEDVKILTPENRVACIEYTTSIVELDKETLKRCKNIIKLLEKGNLFLDGNKILSNDQYLNMVNNKENEEKTKKIEIKRK